MKYLSNLITLYLEGNELESVNITSCKRNKINSIDMSGNKIAKLIQEAFILDCVTESLSVYGNPIEAINPQTIASLPVRAFSVGGHSLSEDALRNLFLGVSDSVIEELFVEDADITHIPPNFFAPLHNKSLSTLSLIGNRLVLYSSVFANLSQVSALLLRNCHLQRIDPNFFDGMAGLRYLNLDSNSITDMNPTGAMWKLNLCELYLSQNEQIEIDNFSFHGLTSCKRNKINSIDMSRNKIAKQSNAGLSELKAWETQPDIKWMSLFHRLYNLSSINISGNFLETLPSGLFKNLTHSASEPQHQGQLNK